VGRFAAWLRRPAPVEEPEPVQDLATEMLDLGLDPTDPFMSGFFLPPADHERSS
jgi:hypothetical protein